VPDYTGELPFGIGYHFKVHLEKCAVTINATIEFESIIGSLYQALPLQIQQPELDAQAKVQNIFVSDNALQVVPAQWFADLEEIFAIENNGDAVKAINGIVDQGDGTSIDPFYESGELSHYYRFEQFVEGKMLARLPEETLPYSFSVTRLF